MAERVTIGNVELQFLLDVTPPPRDISEFFPEVPAEAWAPYRRDYLDENGNLPTCYGASVLRSADRIVLVDSGLGPGPHERFGGARGDLMNKLRANGISPEDVEIVVMTHVHPDHVGWNMTLEGGKLRPTFPRARYLAPKGDWEYFGQGRGLEDFPHVRDNFIGQVVPLQDMGVLELVEGDYVITPEISTVSTPGHSPGHLCILISSQGQKGLVIGDLILSTVQVTEDEWAVRPDVDREEARRSRRAVLDRMEQEGMVVAAPHFPFGQNIGKVVRRQDRRYWQPL